jgi:hypothetical protein
VSVIIVSYGTRDLTLAALRSVEERKAEVPLAAVVVDNASPDDSADAIAREHPEITLIRSPVNRGFAAGANLGARAARGEWLLFLNSDARLTEGALARLLSEARARTRPGALGPRIEGPSGVERSIGRYYGPWRDFVRAFHLYRLFPRQPLFDELHIRRLPSETAPVDWVTGACLFVSREAFEEVGGFDEDYFMYVEDMDLCWRLARRGRVNLYVPGATVHHERGKSPRDEGEILIEGGRAPEIFVKKTGMVYPLFLQRFLRWMMFFTWYVALSLRLAVKRMREEDTDSLRAVRQRCRRSLDAVFGGDGPGN